jgi:hypothetical protein
MNVIRERRGIVAIRMTEAEFTETVEWLELVASDDGFTRDLREVHDRIIPPNEPV